MKKTENKVRRRPSSRAKSPIKKDRTAVLAALPGDPAWKSPSDTSIIIVEDDKTQTRPRPSKSFEQALSEADYDGQAQQSQQSID